MAFLIAVQANDPDQMPSLLHKLDGDMTSPACDAERESWAMGYYAEDRALIIRKPVDVLRTRGLFGLAPDVRSRIVLACVHPGDTPSERPPPFRHKRWLFGYTGDLAGLVLQRERIAEKLPDFVRSEFGNAGGGELAFGMFLADLHRANILEDPLTDASVLARALARTTEAISGLLREANDRTLRAAYVATNGRVVLVARRGVPLFWKRQEGLDASHEGPPDPVRTDFKRLAEALKRFRAIVVAETPCGDVASWTAIPDDQTIAIDGHLRITPIG